MNTINNLFDLSGKTALVTGCKRGIGKAMAIALAEAGADIIGVSASLELQDSAVAKEIKNLGRSFEAYQCNFANRASVYAFVNAVRATDRKIDILVNIRFVSSTV